MTLAETPAEKSERPRGLRRFGPVKLLLAAGALAGAISAILALTGTIQSLFTSPERGVSSIAIQRVIPLTYGQWRRHEGDSGEIPPAQRGLAGRMVVYNVDTYGFEKNTTLPVRLIRYDETTGESTKSEGDPIRVVQGPDCGCFDWVYIPNTGHRYSIEISILPPRADPLKDITALKAVVTEPFDGPAR